MRPSGHETTIYRRDINLGIAVALDWGLIVPVIKHADELSMLGLARSISDLADRARSKKLSPDEVQKGTFTITNPGVFGSTIGIPIINQPQVAILAVGSITKQPAVMTVDGMDTLGIRTKGMLSLSFDHRVVDGSDADRFMADVKKAIETFAGRRGVAVTRALTVARVRVAVARQAEYLAVLAELDAIGRARGGTSGCSAAAPIPSCSWSSAKAARWSTIAPWHRPPDARRPSRPGSASWHRAMRRRMRCGTSCRCRPTPPDRTLICHDGSSMCGANGGKSP